MLTRPFVLLVVAHFFESLGWASLVLLPLYLALLGASRVEIGAIMASAQIGGLLSRPAVGWALDTLGRKPVLVAGTLIEAAGLAMILLVEDIGPLIWVSRILTGIGVGTLFTGYFTFAADVVPESRRTEGLALFGVSGLAPLVFGPIAQQAGAGAMDLRWLLPIVGVCVLGSLAFVLPLTEPGRLHREPLDVRAVASALAHRSLRPVWLANALFSGMVALFTAFTAVTAASRGVETPSSLWFTYATGAIGARVVGARLPDRIGPSNMVTPALGLYVAAALVVAGASAGWEFLSAGLLAGIAHGYCFPVLSGQLVTRAPARVRGSAMAGFTALWDLTGLLLPPIAGWLADRHGDAMMYLGAALCAVFGLALWAMLEHRFTGS